MKSIIKKSKTCSENSIQISNYSSSYINHYYYCYLISDVNIDYNLSYFIKFI